MNGRMLLTPLTPIYALGLALRERRLASGSEPVRRLRLPVVSIGNLSTGGSGKTPLAIALAKALCSRGVAVDVMSRGYGRRGRTAARVDPARSAEEYGDEPLLIARSTGVPVYVAPKRYDAGVLAESGGAPDGHDLYRTDRGSSSRMALHILDDGFQHRQLYRDADILLMGRAELSDRLLPAGNLRETLHAASRAHVLAIPENDPALEADLRRRGLDGAIWRIGRHMEVPQLDGPVLAFCGIARPGQFFAGIEAAGVRVAARHAFRDHHPYTQTDLDRLAGQARAAGATALVTTEKDGVRLEGLQAEFAIHSVPLVSEIANESAAIDWLLRHLQAHR